MIRAITTIAAALFAVAAAAQPAQNQPGRSAPLGFGPNSKDPIKIDADRLDVFDKEQRAVFTGNVVAVQGETTMKCAELTVLYEQQRGQGARRPPSAQGGDSAIRRIDCKGPVTVVSKDQVATGDIATFDRVANKVVLTGNVSLSQCDNVTRGNRLVYDLNNGVANLEGAPATGGRVQALLSPAGKDNAPKQGCQPGAQPPPTQAAAPTPKPVAPQPVAPQAVATQGREPKQQPAAKPPIRRPPQTN
jgi:lipopolysaccharide export system protein LptA